MKKVKINSLKMENFKATEKLEIYAGGKNVVVSGRNGTGKSTVADAYFWLLTGKFSDGSIGEVNFFTADGKVERDKKIHSVEIEFDDQTKIRRESINTFDKRGKFKATTQKFFIDGAELKQKDFDARILQITGGTPLNAFGFCQMNWKERRNILMKMCKVDDSAVIASDESLSRLNLGNAGADTFIAARKTDMKKLSAELEGIPARIDELQSLKIVIDGDEETFSAEVARLKSDLKNAAEKISEIQKNIAEREKPKSELLKVQSEIVKFKGEIERIAIKMEQSDKQIEELREEFKAIQKSKAGICPTCGQKLPSEKFNATKNKRLAEITATGKELKAGRDNLQKEISAQKEELEHLEWQAEEMQNQKDTEKPVSDVENLNSAIAERDKIIEELTIAQNNLARLLRKKDEAEKTQKRIEELKRRDTEVNRKIADCESQINLAEKFIRAKVQLIEDSINSQFHFVKFKMFDVCINGSVKEICEPMIEGVPYNSGLNRGAKLKAALDILGTLQNFYSIELPIFIDDAESYTSNSLVELPNQLFLLKATEGEENLKIEIEEQSAQGFSLEFEEVGAA